MYRNGPMKSYRNRNGNRNGSKFEMVIECYRMLYEGRTKPFSGSGLQVVNEMGNSAPPARLHRGHHFRFIGVALGGSLQFEKSPSKRHHH